jgi:hypothetical protein
MAINVFSIVPIEVWQDGRLTKEQIRVLGALLSFRAKNTDWVWPGRDAIAERCGMHIVNISQATRALVRLGWLVKEGDGAHSKSCQYRVTVPDVGVPTPPLAESATPPLVESATPPLAESATPPLAESARGKEETTEHTTALSAQAVVFDSQTGKFQIMQVCVEEWIEAYRRCIDPAHWSEERTEDWIRAELAKARLWLSDPAHPRRPHQYRNWRRFIEGWLSRSSERMNTPPATRQRRLSQ